jgi:hypothetical protein
MNITSITDKINATFNGQYGHIVCDWYFNQVALYLDSKEVLDYGSGNASIVNFCNVYTSDIVPNNFNNEDTLNFIIDSDTGKINTNKTFDVITVLRNYILYSEIEQFLKVINYLKTHLNNNGFILIGKHTIYDDFGDWNMSIEDWLNSNAYTFDKGITTFWIIDESTINSNSAA